MDTNQVFRVSSCNFAVPVHNSKSSSGVAPTLRVEFDIYEAGSEALARARGCNQHSVKRSWRRAPVVRALSRRTRAHREEFTLSHRTMEDLYETDPPHPYRVVMRVRPEEWLAAVFEERIDPTTGRPWLELTYAHPDLVRWDMWVLHRDAYQTWYEDSQGEALLISNLILYPPGFLFTPTPEDQE